jgi:hypothetical protein
MNEEFSRETNGGGYKLLIEYTFVSGIIPEAVHFIFTRTF